MERSYLLHCTDKRLIMISVIDLLVLILAVDENVSVLN